MRFCFIFLSFFLCRGPNENKSSIKSKNNQDTISLISAKIKNDITNNVLYIERQKLILRKIVIGVI